MTEQTMEKCENCDRAIGKLETPMVWQGNVVCDECYRRLSGSAPNRPADPISSKSRPRAFGIIVPLVAGLVVVSAVICLYVLREEESYQGVPFSKWIQLVRDHDYKTSKMATEALHHFYRDDERREIVSEFGSRPWGDVAFLVYADTYDEAIKAHCAKIIGEDIKDVVTENTLSQIDAMSPIPKEFKPLLQKLAQDPNLDFERDEILHVIKDIDDQK